MSVKLQHALEKVNTVLVFQYFICMGMINSAVFISCACSEQRLRLSLALLALYGYRNILSHEEFFLNKKMCHLDFMDGKLKQ